MRIQHNIMAMNAYRNYTNNVSAMKANLEKLSSGYKINRAGDDAAGLAISEKMRAQITGLETAQKNAKDGISLVQTAEGALTEVHDMLNRMVELATQSANGTYDNTTDRAQLQKEMDQLNAEINRIADSANFNGIKLFDGSMDGTTKVSADTINGGKAMTIADDVLNLHKNASGAGKTSFTIDFTDITLKGDADTGETKINLEMWSPAYDAVLGGEDGTGHTGKKDVLNLEATINTPQASAEQIVDALMKQTDLKSGKIELSYADGNKVEYEVSVGADGKSINFKMTDAGVQAAQKYYDANKDTTDPMKPLDPDTTGNKADNLFRGNFNVGIYSTVGSDFKTDDNQVISTTKVQSGGPDEGVKLANAIVEFSEGDIQDGAGFQIGDQYYVFAGSDKTYNAQYGDNTHVIDIRDLVDETTGKVAKDTREATNPDTYANFTKALERVSVAAADNEMWIVGVNNIGGALTFNERPTNPSDADLTTRSGVESQLRMFSSIDSGKAKSGKALMLQIGDTADSYNQLKVNIGDMHAASLGLDKIKISDQDSAAQAVDVIKAAINKVSDVRGTLGATQNRLDHTINNLSVMTENIQDAESTIRDVDVAEEMMAYTKNNILIQSAQAMLAQANQVPQGVLQLLQ